MLISPDDSQGFLPVARKILKKETFSALCRDHRNFQRRSWKILERWALHRPERVRMLEEKAFLLPLRIEEQAKLEDEALDTDTALALLAQNWTEEEILKSLGVETDLLRLHALSDPLAGILKTFDNDGVI